MKEILLYWIFLSLFMTSVGVITLTFPGCSSPSYNYFEPAPATPDLWSVKISAWQSREAKSKRAETGVLLKKYETYQMKVRREVARDALEWIQGLSKNHYHADGPIDHWATFQETLRKDSEDCDGLELLTRHFLIDMGFPREKVLRMIMFRPRDSAYHVVTLWFEDEDPWLIDPTGTIRKKLTRMSTVSDWVPLKLFDESQEFDVGKQRD